MHSKINKSKHETKIMCLLIISEVHYSYYQGEIMMFDDCNSKNMPGQFTTAHISGCGYLYKHCRSQPFHKTVWCSNQTIDCMYLNAACSNNWRNMWLGWQILTFIKLQILFNLRHIFFSIIVYITNPTLWQMSYQFWLLLALSARDSCLLSIFFPLFHFLWSNKKRIFLSLLFLINIIQFILLLQTCDQLN